MTTLRLSTRNGVSVELTEALSSHGYTRGRGAHEVRLIVLHTAECAEVPSAAEALASWLKGPQAPRAGWHYAVDVDSITQSVRLEDTAWHASAANPYSIGIEHAGRAAQSAAAWGDPFSAGALELSARLVACLCDRYGIDPVRPSLETLKTSHAVGGASGICGHWDLSRSIGGTHTDPGPNFPWDAYLARVKELLE
jgi:N-acetyl-anhydromuramyl-L-alanine amidase AmpD